MSESIEALTEKSREAILEDLLDSGRSVTPVEYIARTEIIRLTARIAELAWQPIDTAPYSTPVEVRVGSMTFLARLEPDASLSDDEQPCDQWQAVNEGEHPPCWSEGACWSSNTDEVMSRQPEAWRFARTALEASERGGGE